MTRLLELLRRGARASPFAVARWLARHAKGELDQHLAPGRQRKLTEARLLAELGADDLDRLWARLTAAPFPATTQPVAAEAYEKLCPGDAARIRAAAAMVMERRVDLLGSGPVALGTPIDWHRDFKSGHSWPLKPHRRLDVLDLDNPSDVKAPWELARLQWLIPAGQAYLLDGGPGAGGERYAEAARQAIEEWIAANPLGQGVNWASTMEVALRGITLVWLFRVFHASTAWRDDRFRLDFLRALFLHGDFARRHLEWSDVNGNHLLAGAAGLAVIGMFLGAGRRPAGWARTGWKILAAELPRQVFPDGVDFEASTAYHRLVLELLLLPALYARALGRDVPEAYAGRLRRMAGFVAAYGRADGSSPLWGDADDGRVLPFGPQPINDHRYLIALVALAFDDRDLLAKSSGPAAEAFWLLGPEAAAKIPKAPRPLASRAFPDGGVYVMRGTGDDAADHVFIDCGPVGMKGRGGHGHNDCLSVDAALAGAHLLADCGAYVYSADPEWRNSFRSTAFHNTPVIDGEEQNRFVRPEYLWTLIDDATSEVRLWQPGDDADRFVGAHSGYRRLARPLTPVRAVTLYKRHHRLVVVDAFETAGPDDTGHHIRVPFHLAPGVAVEAAGAGVWRLATPAGTFLLAALDVEAWSAAVGDGWVSPRYGVKVPAKVVNFIRDGALKPLAVALLPAAGAPDDPRRWLAGEADAAFTLPGMPKA